MQWNTALYLRLSRDDGLSGTSESIKNQQAFLEKYAENNGLQVAGIYKDDGYSGTTFNRPGFLELIADIEHNKINCIITKDLSRLGRDYIMTGHYLERYFPEHHVRYIAVTDGFDTYSSLSNNEMSPFKAVFNDMYAKDISKKVRTAIATKREQGKFIGAFAPYGYAKDPKDKNHLIIDEESADVVKEIFAMALAGETILGIANQLSMKGIPTPSQYKQLKNIQQRLSGVWNDSIIRRILKNETYIGNLVQNRSRKINYKVDKKVAIPPSEWVVVKGTHDPIISAEEFEKVQHLLKIRQYHKNKRVGNSHLLSGIVYCQQCGAPMSFVKESETRSYLVCSTWRKHTKLHLCSAHCIRETLVENVIKEKLQELVQQAVVVEEIYEVEWQDFTEERKELQQCALQLETTNKTLLSLYKDKVGGVITENNFTSFATELNKETTVLQQRIQELNRKANISPEQLKEQIRKLLSFTELDRAMISTLINRITIGDEKQITIEFNFESEQ